MEGWMDGWMEGGRGLCVCCKCRRRRIQDWFADVSEGSFYRDKPDATRKPIVSGNKSDAASWFH